MDYYQYEFIVKQALEDDPDLWIIMAIGYLIVFIYCIVMLILEFRRK